MLSDLALARRLERAEGRACVEFIEARKALFPASGAAWIETAGTYAAYDGPRSPVTQTFALGMLEPATAEVLASLEAFFKERGAPVLHEISPLAGKSLWPLLHARGYHPVEFSSVMYLPLAGRSPVHADPRVTVRLAGETERELWVGATARGWSDSTDAGDLLLDLMRVTASRADALCFLAELEHEAIGGGLLVIHDGVALLAGACTIPERRNRGGQRALLDARLRYAEKSGCELAMMCAEPGSASQRNAERHGFRIAYTRIKWGLS
jgi:GNAT superfamily N-acetyltransferase